MNQFLWILALGCFLLSCKNDKDHEKEEEPQEAYDIGISPDSLHFEPEGGQSTILTKHSKWGISGLQDNEYSLFFRVSRDSITHKWVTLKKRGDSQLVVIVSPNTAEEGRKMDVTLQTSDNGSGKLQIVQGKKENSH